MTVDTTFTRLAALLLAVDPTPSTALTRVITDASQRWNVGDLPLGILRLSSEDDGWLRTEAMQLGRHDYIVEAALMLGVVTGPDLIDPLHNLTKPWPEAVLAKLATDITLGGTVAFIGYEGSDRFLKYRPGALLGPETPPTIYWGLRFWIPVTAKPVIANMG